MIPLFTFPDRFLAMNLQKTIRVQDWWMWPETVPGGTQIDPGAGTGAIFKTVPYTGTKTSDEFYSDDYEGGLFFSNNTPEKGYTAALSRS